MGVDRVTWKITVIGQPKVGKSSLISRIVYDSDSSVIKQRALPKKKMTIDHDGRKVIADLLFLELQDEEGVEKLITGSNCIIVAVDVTRGEELEISRDIVKYLRSFEDGPLIVLAGTKSDLRYEAAVWKNDFEKVSRELDVEYFLTSSKTADSVQDMLDYVIENLLEKFYAKRKPNA